MQRDDRNGKLLDDRQHDESRAAIAENLGTSSAKPPVPESDHGADKPVGQILDPFAPWLYQQLTCRVAKLELWEEHRYGLAQPTLESTELLLPSGGGAAFVFNRTREVKHANQRRMRVHFRDDSGMGGEVPARSKSKVAQRAKHAWRPAAALGIRRMAAGMLMMEEPVRQAVNGSRSTTVRDNQRGVHRQQCSGPGGQPLAEFLQQLIVTVGVGKALDKGTVAGEPNRTHSIPAPFAPGKVDSDQDHRKD